MTINHTTWLLDWSTHDLCLDAYGNIAVASAPYSIAQDGATQASTFLGECWYDATQGVDWWGQILGQDPPASLVASLIETQVELVPDVQSAVVTLAGIDVTRNGVGQLAITDTDGNTNTMTL